MRELQNFLTVHERGGDEFDNSISQEELSLIPYCFYFDYARKNDRDWQTFLQSIEVLIPVRKKKRSSQHFRSKKRTVPWDWPDEIVSVIVTYMDAKSLTTVSSLNKKWNQIASARSVWDDLCLTSYQLSWRECAVTHPKMLYRRVLESFRSVARSNGMYGPKSVVISSPVLYL